LDGNEKKFWIGTKEYGIAFNRGVIALYIQV